MAAERAAGGTTAFGRFGLAARPRVQVQVVDLPVAHADRREAERDVRPLQLAVRLDATEAHGQLLGGRPLLAGAQLPDDGRALRALLAGVEDLDAQTRVLVEAARPSGEAERRLAGGDARDGARRGAARRK